MLEQDEVAKTAQVVTNNLIAGLLSEFPAVLAVVNKLSRVEWLAFIAKSTDNVEEVLLGRLGK